MGDGWEGVFHHPLPQLLSAAERSGGELEGGAFGLLGPAGRIGEGNVSLQPQIIWPVLQCTCRTDRTRLTRVARASHARRTNCQTADALSPTTPHHTTPHPHTILTNHQPSHQLIIPAQLDNLPITEAEKRQMSGSVQQ